MSADVGLRPPSGGASSFLKTWLIAVRPFAYTGSVGAVLLGLGLCVDAGIDIQWGLLALTLVGVVCFHTGANLLNDAYDYRRGLDREVLPLSGAIVRGLLTESQVRRGGILFLVVGSLCGLALTWAAGWVVLALGCLGSLIAWGYTGPGLCLKYARLGDLAIFLAFGILPVFGAWWVQTRVFSWAPFLWAVPMVSYTVGILHANNWRDIGGDSRRACHTLAGALGPRGSARYYRLLVLGPFVWVAALWGISRFVEFIPPAPWTVLLVFCALPLALGRVRIDAERDQERFVQLDGLTAQLHMVFCSLLTGGFLLGGLG